MRIHVVPKPNPRVEVYERAWSLLTRDNALAIEDAPTTAEFVRLRSALTHRIRRHFGGGWMLRQQRTPQGWVVWAEPRPSAGEPSHADA